MDVKKKLEELANRKRKEQEEAVAAEHKKRQKALKAAIDFGESDEDEPEQAQQDDGPEVGADDNRPAINEEDEEGNIVRGPEDDDFIDDTGVAPDQIIDFGDDDMPEGMYEEAEEAEDEDDMAEEDELDRLFNKRPRKEENNAENRAKVDNLLSKMEAAAELDMQAFEASKPALAKLRILHEVEELVATKKLRDDLLNNGILGVFRAWLEPLPDMSLPNAKIRSSVLQMLDILPIDCNHEDRKSQLKNSGLGRIVMFLSKLPDELPANRRLAKRLIEKWSRPLLAQRPDEDREQEEQQKILEARQRREAAKKKLAEPVADDDGENPAAVKKPGQAGFRYRAHIPESAALDYVRRPQSKVPSLAEQKSGGKAGEHKLVKKLRLMNKKG